MLLQSNMSLLSSMHWKSTVFACNSCFFTLTLVSNCVCLTVFLLQMGWKPSLSFSGQNSVRKTLSSGWPVKNTRPLILRQNCCPKPNIFIQFLLNRMPLKRYGIFCLFIIKCNGAEKLTQPLQFYIFFGLFVTEASWRHKYLYHCNKSNSGWILKHWIVISLQQTDLCERR